MAEKTERAGFRADEANLALIHRAAIVVNEPTTEFVRKPHWRARKLCCAEGS